MSASAPGSDDLLDRRLRIPTHVVFRTFVTETIALNLESGQFHGLNPTAGRMVEVGRDELDLRRAAAVLAGEFERPVVEMQEALRGLIASLHERGLVELS